jgi:undecaprenyl-diphosphatase
VLVVYGARLFELLRGALRREPAALRLVGLLIIGTIPAAFVGLVLKDLVERTFDSLWWAGAGFLTTGFLLWSTKDRGGDRTAPGRLTALLIGVAQALAVLPGVSRSGSTVSVALWARMRPVDSAEFSFLLAIPAIAGAAVLEGGEGLAHVAVVGVAPLLVSCAVAFVTGVWAIRFLIALLRRGRFYVFAPYCWVVGVLTLALAAWRP